MGGVGHGVWREVSTQAEWWHMIVTSAFERLVQEDHEFEARRGHGAVVDDDDDDDDKWHYRIFSVIKLKSDKCPVLGESGKDFETEVT